MNLHSAHIKLEEKNLPVCFRGNILLWLLEPPETFRGVSTIVLNPKLFIRITQRVIRGAVNVYR